MNAALKLLAIAATLGALTAPALASGPSLSVFSATAGITNPGEAVDGFVPANWTDWTTDSAWWDTPGQALVLKFDQAYKLSSAVVTLDWNDVYRFQVSTDNVTYKTLFTTSGLWDQPDGADVTAGQVTMPVSFAATATAYSYLRITAIAGDGFASVGEVSLNGTPAVPEPATLAMMLAGMGVVGLRMRQRRNR